MVVPLHTQEDWMPLLDGLTAFVPGSDAIAILSPHPDDETLAVGGLITAQRERGYPVKLIAVTDGENAYPENGGLADQRIAEQTRAAERLGIDANDLLRLHLTDSGVAAKQCVLIKRLLPYVSRETHLLAPWPDDFHPDHEACGRAAKEIALQTGCQLTFYFFWTWHRGTPDLLRGLPLRRLELAKSHQDAKAEALAMHVSQLDHPSGDPILHAIHLWPAMLPFEVYLPA